MKKWFADPLCENCNGYFENWVFGKPDDPRASSSSESCHETEYSASVSGIWGSGRPTPAYLSSAMILFLNINSLSDDSQIEMCSVNSNQGRRKCHKTQM